MVSNLDAVRDGWQEAWRFRWPLIAAHLANRLLLAAIIVPVAAASCASASACPIRPR